MRAGSASVVPQWANKLELNARSALNIVVQGPHAHALQNQNTPPCSAGCNYTWTKMIPGTPTRRYHAAISAMGTTLYAVGGVADDGGNDFKVLGSVEAFHTSNHTWANSLPAMPAARGDLAVATIGTVLYAVGGTDGTSSVVNTVEAFDTNTGSQKWTGLPPLQVARAGLSVAAVGTTLYALGGVGDDFLALGTLEAFDTVAQKWNNSHKKKTPNVEQQPAVPAHSKIFLCSWSSREYDALRNRRLQWEVPGRNRSVRHGRPNMENRAPCDANSKSWFGGWCYWRDSLCSWRYGQRRPRGCP